MDISSRGTSNYLPRILRYRKQVRIGISLVKYLSYLSILIFFLSIFGYFFLKDHNHQIISILISSGLSFVILYLQYFFLLRPFAIFKMQVFPDKIFIQQGKKEIHIPFEEVIEIKSAVNKNFGGWFTLILKDKKNYRFTIALERADYILDAIIKYSPDLMEKIDYQILRKKLILSDHGLSRFYDMFREKYRLITFTHEIILPIIFITLLYLKQKNEFIIHIPTLYFLRIIIWTVIYSGIMWLIFSYLINRILDKNMTKRLEEDSSNKKRDTEFEFKTYKKIFPAYLFLLFIFYIGVYSTDANILGFTSLNNDSEVFGIRPKQRLFYDGKYNCTDCKFKVAINDLIYTYEGIGKIVALPNQKINIDIQDSEGRFLSSQQEKIVADKNVAIQTVDDKIIMIDEKIIRGKIFKK